MGMSYSVSTKEITVSGYSEVTPANFEDFATQDRAGAGTILLAAIAGAANNTLTYPVRPVEFRALIIKCIVAAKTAEADFIFITGTDAWDVAQTESIDVTIGNGTYTSTKRFRTITNIDCSDNAAGGGTVWADGTISVTQDIWGVIWDFGSRSYAFDCKVYISNGAWFLGTKRNITVNEGVLFASSDIFWDVATGGNCTFGTGDTADKYGYNGINWTIINATGSWFTFAFRQQAASTFNFYDCHVLFPEGWPVNNRKCIAVHTPEDRIYSCSFSNSHYGINQAKGSMDINHVDFNSVYGPIVRFGESGSGGGINNTNLMYAYQAFYFQHGAGVTVEIENIFMLDITRIFCHANFDGVVNIINPKSVIPGWIYWQAGSDGVINEKYRCNIHVNDKDGTNLASATVLCEDQYGTQIFSVASDANGDIAEQTINYRARAISATTTYSPHKFTISKAGYKTLVIDNITVSNTVKWTVELQPFDYPPGPF